MTSHPATPFAASAAAVALRWHRVETAGWLGAGLLLAVGSLELARQWHPASLLIGVALGGIGALAWRRQRRDQPLNDTALAKALDAEVPAVQASAGLLLADPASLGLLERLQVTRVEPAASTALRTLRFPMARLAIPGLLAALGLGSALLARLAPAANGSGATSSAVTPAALAVPRVESVELVVRPPAYTGRPERRERTLDVEVEAGARVEWQVRVAPAPDSLRLRLLTSDGDTIAFSRTGAGPFIAALTAAQPTLYELQGMAGLPSGVHRLAVIPDRAPALTIVRPDERTTIESGQLPVVEVEVLGRDDYGLGAATIVATVTSGQGESVKFREQRLPFSSTVSRGPAAALWRTRLDLEALGVKPGDELYFHVLAQDRRTPVPNEGRSETVFIRRADTTKAAVAEFSGLALKVTPDYFRSQRQIIIDTEKLLAEQQTISLERFRERSNDIGIDQHLLRVRYGELVGDENVSGPGHAVAERLEAMGIETGEPHADEGGMPMPEGLGPKAMPVTPEDELHKHDDSENATRLAREVKATLQDALREMWSAERHLRTYDPRTALPYEYRALEYLKQVQQAARVYVKRVGFEPPPLEPDRKRLTGKQDAIRDARRVSTRDADVVLPAVRTLLAGMESVGDSDALPAALRPAARAAGEELARRALESPGTQLDALGDLRRWLDGDAECGDCAARVRRHLYALLPAPATGPERRLPSTAAARRYAERLRALR